MGSNGRGHLVIYFNGFEKLGMVNMDSKIGIAYSIATVNLLFREKRTRLKWVCLKIVHPYTQWFMIIIPTKWL